MAAGGAVAERRRRRLRLPRWTYWVAGAAIAFGGAIAARQIGEMTGYTYRVAVWLGGAVCIFVGLAIVSLGTRARLEDELLFAEENNTLGENGKRNGGNVAGNVSNGDAPRDRRRASSVPETSVPKTTVPKTPVPRR